MLKKDLLNFIERVEKKALISVRSKWNEEIKNKENEVMGKYKEKISMYQGAFNRFSTNLTELLTDMREDIETGYTGSRYVSNGLDYLTTLNSSIKKCCQFNGEVAKLRDLRNREIEEVELNYKKVWAVSKTMTPNKIEEYLTGLGFDLSSLKEDEMKYLSTDIDKSKLFVCGENK